MGRLCILFTDPWISVGTLPETNIAPENRPSQKETSIPTIHFQGRAVSFRDCKYTVRPSGNPSWDIYFALYVFVFRY